MPITEPTTDPTNAKDNCFPSVVSISQIHQLQWLKDWRTLNPTSPASPTNLSEEVSPCPRKCALELP